MVSEPQSDRVLIERLSEVILEKLLSPIMITIGRKVGRRPPSIVKVQERWHKKCQANAKPQYCQAKVMPSQAELLSATSLTSLPIPAISEKKAEAG